MNLSPLRSTLSRLSSPLDHATRTGGLDQSLLPYVPKVVQAEQQKQNSFQPLQFVLDLLQRGQYLTANVADEIVNSAQTGKPLGQATVDTLKAAFQGLTGARKGDWETLLFGGNITGGGERPGWLPENMKGPGMSEPLIKWGGQGSTGFAEGILRPRKLIGLAANIAGDPLTYMTFGATEAARAAASKYAQDVVKLTVATMGTEDLAKLGAKAAAGNTAEAAIKSIEKAGSLQGKRFLSETYNQAYMNALRNPSQKIIQDVAPRLEVAGQRLETNPGLQSLISTMIPETYANAGERAFGFMGKEMGKGIRQPWMPTRAWDTIKARFDSRVGQSKLGDAWYSMMENGLVGKIKQAFGIRNPYEQMLNLTKRRISDHGEEFFAQQETAKYEQIFKNQSEDVVNATQKAMIHAQGRPGTFEQQVLQPDFQAHIGINPEHLDAVRGLQDKIQTVTRDEFDSEWKAAQAAGQPYPASESLVYFPQNATAGELAGGQMGAGGRPASSGATGFTKAKKMTVEDHIQNNADMFKFLMGPQLQKAWEEAGGETVVGTFDKFVRDFVVNKGMTETSLNLKQAFTLRGVAHAKAMAKYNMIEEFRQFGVPEADVMKAAPGLAPNIQTWGGNVSSATGLFKVSTPGFEGLLFDAPTAEIVTNAGKALAGDPGLLRYLDKATNLWKGFTTMTPGFHIRNAISNNITGFLKFGPAWLDPRKDIEAMVGVAYAMNPSKYMDVLKSEFKLPDGVIAQALNRRVNGDFTVKELADYARQSGVLSSRTQVKTEGITQAIFKPSRVTGDFIENNAKFKSFLIDYERMAGDAGQTGMDLAARLANQKQFLEYADAQTKKWFLDYGDLTPFEQNVMKKIIPFYTWARKNIANQITGLITMPQTYEIIPKVRNAMTTDQGFNYNLVPDYMRNQGYFPVGRTSQGTDIMRWANIPLEDLNKIPLTFQGNKLSGVGTNWGEFVNDVFSNAHPLIKTIVEMISGKDTFHKRDIRSFETAAPVFQYLNNSPKVVQFLDGVMRTAGFENGIRMHVSPNGKEMQLDGKVERFLETNVPALRTLDMFISTPEVMAEQFSPAIEKWIEDTFGKKDYYTGLEELFQVISRVGGWKFKEISQEEEARLKEAELRAKLSQAKSADEKDRLAYAARMAKAKQTATVRNRSLFGSYTRGM